MRACLVDMMYDTVLCFTIAVRMFRFALFINNDILPVVKVAL